MTLPRSAADVLKDHVTLEVEGIDRMYLNVYQPRLQTDRGVAAFFRFHRGETFASSALMAPMSTAFIDAVDRFVEQEQVRVYASAWDVWGLSAGAARFSRTVRLAGDRMPLVPSNARITRQLQGRPHHGLRPRLDLLPAP